MKCNLYCISKADSVAMIQEYITKARQFGANLNVVDIFTPSIAKAQKSSPKEAQQSYSNALKGFIKPQSLNIALHPQSQQLDSMGFAKMLENNAEVNFFIAGAYGFEQDFLQRLKSISLSSLTLSHKVAKIVLCEQIYRALSIIANHPYHK